MTVFIQALTSPNAEGGTDVSLFPFQHHDECRTDALATMRGHGGKWFDQAIEDWRCEDGWTLSVHAVTVG